MNFPLSFPIGWRSLGAWSAGTASPGLAIPGLEPAAAGAPVLGPHARGCPRRSAVLRGSATRAAACVSPRGTDPLRKRPAAIARPRLLFPAARAHTEPAETPPSPARAAAPPRPRLGRIADFQMQRDARAGPSSRRHRTTRSWPQRLRGTGTAPRKAATGTGGARRAGRASHAGQPWLRASGGARSRRHLRSPWLPRALFSGARPRLDTRTLAQPRQLLLPRQGVPVRASKRHKAPLFPRHRPVHAQGVLHQPQQCALTPTRALTTAWLCGDTARTEKPAGGTETTELL